jgi:hypothetical protein
MYWQVFVPPSLRMTPLPGAALPPVPPQSGVTLRQSSGGETLLLYVFPLLTIPKFFCCGGGCGVGVNPVGMVQVPAVTAKQCPSSTVNPQPGGS